MQMLSNTNSNFPNEVFASDLQYKCFQSNCNFETLSFKVFKETVGATLKKYAPLKKSYVRGNQAPFIKKKN